MVVVTDLLRNILRRLSKLESSSDHHALLNNSARTNVNHCYRNGFPRGHGIFAHRSQIQIKSDPVNCGHVLVAETLRMFGLFTPRKQSAYFAITSRKTGDIVYRFFVSVGPLRKEKQRAPFVSLAPRLFAL